MNYCWILDSENEEELDSGNWILKPHKIFGLDSGFWILKLSERTGKKLLEARPWILDEMVYAEPRSGEGVPTHTCTFSLQYKI
mgnify:CR=1 FL=1